MSNSEQFGQSTPPPQPAGGGQLGSDTTKIFVQDGQTLGQGIGIKPVLGETPAESGGGGNVASDDNPMPGKAAPTSGNPVATPPRPTHSSGGAFKVGIPNMKG
jgi:hypothetical protein